MAALSISDLSSLQVRLEQLRQLSHEQLVNLILQRGAPFLRALFCDTLTLAVSGCVA